jgi:hypothetical protein
MGLGWPPINEMGAEFFNRRKLRERRGPGAGRENFNAKNAKEREGDGGSDLNDG